MKHIKQIACIVAVVACIVNSFSVGTVFAETEYFKYNDYLSYEKVDKNNDKVYDYIVISECDASAVSVEIPSEIDGLTVVGIGYGSFSGCTELESITLPDTITTISKNAFNECKSLKSVIIPDSVTYIGPYAFAHCKSLTSVELSDNVTNIESETFLKCISLKNIIVPKSVTYIGNEAFHNCEVLESITIENPDCEIHDHLTTISSYRFPTETDKFFTGTIYGYENSTAQAYAEKYEYNFTLIAETPTSEIVVPEDAKATIYGDINLDESINIADIVAINMLLLNPTENSTNSTAIANSDCVNNGIINTADSAFLMNYVNMMATQDQLGKN